MAAVKSTKMEERKRRRRRMLRLGSNLGINPFNSLVSPHLLNEDAAIDKLLTKNQPLFPNNQTSLDLATWTVLYKQIC